MAKRVGCVLIFRAGTSKEEAANALAAIRGYLDTPDEHFISVDGPPIAVGPYRGNNTTTAKKVPFKIEHLVHEYDDEYGEPVWYVP